MTEKMKEYTEETMKIEMLPWVESHTVDMDELYTELTLEQIENKPAGQIPVKLDNYAQLFTTQETIEQQENPSPKPIPNTTGPKIKQKKGKKILAKGDPGTGKSTLAKKIAYGWAKGKFTAVSVAFLVEMKLVEKGQTIENIIIQQNPPIESLDITEEKLCKILKDLGNRCLIILDGFDEHDPQPGDDIRKIIEGRKLPDCSLLVISRPHNCEKIERCFSTKSKVNGFTKTRAEQFASNFLNDTKKVQAVSTINSRNFLSPDKYSNPMLLLFLCVLENNNQLDETVLSLGDIYFRLIRCMYRKYCARKGIEFDHSEFRQVLEQVGKIAWKMLDSSTNYAQQSEIVIEAGIGAFEYGLFAGHKDYRLTKSETTNIFVTFVHQTIQEFFGAFHFICVLNTKGSINVNISPVRPYFLEFSLWLLSDTFNSIKFDNRSTVYKILTGYVKRKIDLVQLDLTAVTQEYKALHMEKSDHRHTVEFVKKVLSMCENMKELYISHFYNVDQILAAVQSSIQHLRLVANRVALDKNSKVRHDDLGVNESQLVVVESTGMYLDMIQILTGFTERALALVMLSNDIDEEVEITEFIHSCLSKFHIFSLFKTHLTANKDISCCSTLTEIVIANFDLKENVLKALARAMAKRDLPVLSKLSFKNCGSSLKGKIHMLFQSRWEALTDLSIYKCLLDNCDIELLLNGNRNNILPNLTSLTIGLSEVSDWYLDFFPPGDKRNRNIDNTLFSMLTTQSLLLTSFSLHDVTKEEYQEFVSLINKGYLPNLIHLGVYMWLLVDKLKKKTESHQYNSVEKLAPVNLSTLTSLSLLRFVCSETHLLTAARSAKFSNVHKLDISHGSHIGGKLFILVGHSFPSLNTLILSECNLASTDLKSLARASTHGRLPKLEHLDISRNGYAQSHLQDLFSFQQKWENLLVLKVQQDPNSQKENNLQLMLEFVRSGCLSSLTELHVSVGQQDSQFDCRDFTWTTLNSLRIFSPEDQSVKAAIVATIYKTVKNECLTGLRQLFLISIKIKQQMSDFMDGNPRDVWIRMAKNGLNEHILTQYTRLSAEELSLLAAENSVTPLYQNQVAQEFATSHAPFFANNIRNSFGLPSAHAHDLQSTFDGTFEVFTRFCRGEIDSEQMAQGEFEVIRKTLDKHSPFPIAGMFEPMIKSVFKSLVENIPAQSDITHLIADLNDSFQVLFSNIFCLRKLGVLVYNEYSEK